jgi:hypothetical protein
MRHTFCSNLLGLGLTIAAVADQMRDTVAVMKRHYYAPIPKAVAKRLWSLPMGLRPFENLPITERFWDWHSPLNTVLIAEGGSVQMATEPATAATPVGGRRAVKRRAGPIAWPDDLELQVLLWEKSQAQIGRGLSCAQTTVSAYAIKQGLLIPKSDYLLRLKHNLPVEVPQAVLKARELLAARKSGTIAKSGADGATPQSAPSTTESHKQKPISAPNNQETKDNNQQEN